MKETDATVKSLLLQLEELSKNFANVQADILKWKENKEQCTQDENMETEIPQAGNPAPATTVSETPLYEAVNLISRESS